MRVPPDRRSKKASKKSTASERPVDAQHANDYAAIEAELEKNPFHKGNTAGGRKPPYKPEYAQQAKGMCARGATIDQLAKFFGVSVGEIEMWQVIYPLFFKACKLTAGSIERVRRSAFESSAGFRSVKKTTVVSGGQVRTVVSTVNLPPNISACKLLLAEPDILQEGELKILLRQLQGTRVRPTYTGPDGTMMILEEHQALGGTTGGETDWSKKSPEELNQKKIQLLEMRKNP